MRRFKDSKDSVANKIASAFKFNNDAPEDFVNSMIRYKDDVYSLVRNPSGTMELGVYIGGNKLNYKPIKALKEYSKEEVKNAIVNYLNKKVSDSVAEVVNFDASQVIPLLERALADELIAYWQYESVKNFVIGEDGIVVEEMFDEFAKDELLDHASKLLRRLNELGANVGDFYDIPTLLSLASAPQNPILSINTADLIAQNILSEKVAIETYTMIFELCKSINDGVTEKIIKEILEDEQEHLTRLVDQHNNITRSKNSVEVIISTVQTPVTTFDVMDSFVSSGKVWKRVSDVDESLQTDELKTELYNLTLQFVRKYWRRYYPAFKGEPEDLAADFYEQFITKKGRGEKKESLLDKFNPEITTLPYLVKIAVQRMLIDRSRTDKKEKNYVEKYTEEGDLSLDYLASKIDEQDVSVDDITFSEDDIFYLRDLYDELSVEQKKHFLRMYKEVKGVLSPNFKELFRDLVGY